MSLSVVNTASRLSHSYQRISLPSLLIFALLALVCLMPTAINARFKDYGTIISGYLDVFTCDHMSKLV
jgi:hypothetical protein